MKIAVVGAGIFGVTIACKLAEKHEVHLFEKNNTILAAASRANQLRIHRGYHYPRSPETVQELSHSFPAFMSEYRDAVVDYYEHYYCIAREKTLVSGSDYLTFCLDNDLTFQKADNFSVVNHDMIDVVIRADECLIDYRKLKEICQTKLGLAKVNVSLNTLFQKSAQNTFDVIVNCTYASTNCLLPEPEQTDYQFEICEKILVKPPDSLRSKSIVIMDGPFMCIDPYGKSDLSLLGNVVHAIHKCNTGKVPEIPSYLVNFIDAGLVHERQISKFDSFVATGREYIQDLEKCEYVGSFYTVRAVLPKMETSDARPTIVTRNKGKMITVFSGKIDTCVNAANSVSEILEKW